MKRRKVLTLSRNNMKNDRREKKQNYYIFVLPYGKHLDPKALYRAIQYLADVVSPMLAHAQMLKKNIKVQRLYLSDRAFPKKTKQKNIKVTWNLCLLSMNWMNG